MPPTYVFVIDVSHAAAASGMLAAACATIKGTLDSLPGDERTLVAFITFDKWVGGGGGWMGGRAGGWPGGWPGGRVHAQCLPSPCIPGNPAATTVCPTAPLTPSHIPPRALPCPPSHNPPRTLCSTIHFYNLKSSLSAPQMMVVPEIDDPFVPLPDDLLVNLRDSRAVVEALLESLPQGYARTSQVCAGGGGGVWGARGCSRGFAERSNHAPPA